MCASQDTTEETMNSVAGTSLSEYSLSGLSDWLKLKVVTYIVL